MLQKYIEKIDRWRYEQIASYCLGSVLDIACGLQGLADFVPIDKYIGCDLNGGNLHCSAYNLAFSEKSFDTVVMGEVLEHLGMPLIALEEAARVARQRIIVTVPNDYSLVRLSRVMLGRHADLESEHILSYNSWNLQQLFSMIGFELKEYFCYPIRLQLLPEIPIKSRFGYWLFAIADILPTKKVMQG
ncbi:MAG: class I SAM-dependent methyltransferase [Desulfamplus sp.]